MENTNSGANNIRYLGGDDSVVSKALRYVVAMLGEAVCYINRPGVTLMGGVKALRDGRTHEKREGRGVGQERGTNRKYGEKERKLVTYNS